MAEVLPSLSAVNQPEENTLYASMTKLVAAMRKPCSANYDPHAYLQFEICQGSNTDAEYYWQAIGVAEEYCAYLCRLYGWGVDKITSHKEAHAAGLASNHGDPQSWMKYFGDSMDKFRARVNSLLNKEISNSDGLSENPTHTTSSAVETIVEPASPIKYVKDVYKMKTIRNGSTGTQVRVL